MSPSISRREVRHNGRRNVRMSNEDARKTDIIEDFDALIKRHEEYGIKEFSNASSNHQKDQSTKAKGV